MHQSALRLRSCYQSTFRWCFYCRRLSTAGPVPVVNSDRQALNALELWQYGGGKALAKRAEDAKDINIDDLSATLEAHRASNRAAVIRKVNIDANDFAGQYKRLVLEQDSDGRSEFKKTHEEKENEPNQMWPADSMQAKEKYGKTGCRGFVKKNDPLEYTGAVQWPKERWIIPKHCKDMQLQRPWLAYIETTGEDALERLTNEIKAYEAYMRLSPREEAASELVVSDVNSVARNELEIKPLTLLGSRSTGLATPISDFDFSFTMPVSLAGGWMIPPSEDSVSQSQPLNYARKRCEALRALRKMKRHFDSSRKFCSTEIIPYARVPLVRSKHIATGLDVQIQTMAPYQAAHEYTVAYLSEFPSLRPLYIILRYCLELRDLTTVFKGGLGSYSILMMIVTALKHSSGKFSSDDLGSQLLHVLDFYGEADLYKVGFSADPPRIFEKQKKLWPLKERAARMSDPQLIGIDHMQTFYPRKPYLLCLQDPANDLNDLGKNAYAIKHIQATFRQAKHTIQTALESNNEESDDSERGKMWSCLDQVVRADYRAFELHRSRTERCTSRKKPNDRDDSEEKVISREFEKRVNRYKDRVAKKQRGKGSRRGSSSVVKKVKSSVITKIESSVVTKVKTPLLRKRYLDAFKLRYTTSPTLHKSIWASGDVTRRLESDGAILPPSRRDQGGFLSEAAEGERKDGFR